MTEPHRSYRGITSKKFVNRALSLPRSWLQWEPREMRKPEKAKPSDKSKRWDENEKGHSCLLPEWTEARGHHEFARVLGATVQPVHVSSPFPHFFPSSLIASAHLLDLWREIGKNQRISSFGLHSKHLFFLPVIHFYMNWNTELFAYSVSLACM